jgi:hypothetical protein
LCVQAYQQQMKCKLLGRLLSRLFALKICQHVTDRLSVLVKYFAMIIQSHANANANAQGIIKFEKISTDSRINFT